jgi:creatinine amidohydrolase
MDLVENICDEVHRNGFGKIVLLHGHGGNVALHGAILKRALERLKPYALYSIPVFGSKGGEIAKLLETKDWGHACEMETSLNLVAAPGFVNLKRLGRKTFPTKPGPKVGAAAAPVDWNAKHPEMAVGIPQKATKAKGQRISDLWTEEVVGILRRIKRDRCVPREMRAFARQARAPRSRGGR